MLAPEGTTRTTSPIFTVGETFPTLASTDERSGYTPPGNLDGMGAYIPPPSINSTILRVFVSHELHHDIAYEYTVNNGDLTLRGARISYLDLDRQTLQVQAAGLAYDKIYDCGSNMPADTSFLGTPYLSEDARRPVSRMEGFGRFCSAMLVEKGKYGFEDTIYFANEEEGGDSNSVGGNVWALDVENRELWQAAALGRGAFENAAPIESGSNNTVALILMDDTGPFNFRKFSFNQQFDSDNEKEAAPLYLYVGNKIPKGGFLERNGLAQGKVYVLALDDDSRNAADFNGTTAALQPKSAKWLQITGNQNLTLASPDGSTGYDICGYPTQAHRWTEAERLGAFGFSRPEDAHTNPFDSAEVVFSSTGRKDFAGNADLVGTIYKVRTEFDDNSVPTGAEITILYDGDADSNRGLRSPDNLFWSEDGYVYVQEDKANDHDQDGVDLFGSKAINKNEAGIVRLDPITGEVSRVAGIDRRVVMDPTTYRTPYDTTWKKAGAWESSGIIEISDLVEDKANSCDRIFLANVQAHGIKDQTKWNSKSRIHDKDLYSGGQMVAICT